MVDPQSRAFEVEALLQNKDGTLKSGFFARATIASSHADVAQLVPQEALRYLYGVYKLYAVERGALRETEVKLGARNGDEVEAGRGAPGRCAGGGSRRSSDERPAMTLAELCVRRGVFAVMLIAFLVVLGVFSFRDLGVDLFPRADPATVNIKLRLPGATPEEITTQVLLPLEEALSTISGLDELSSTATEGSARIRCQFVLEREIESAAQDVREKVAGALRDLPPNILPRVIQKADPDADPVLTLKRIKRVLETVDGVGEVSLTGARLRQIRVFTDADKLAA